MGKKGITLHISFFFFLIILKISFQKWSESAIFYFVFIRIYSFSCCWWFSEYDSPYVVCDVYQIEAILHSNSCVIPDRISAYLSVFREVLNMLNMFKMYLYTIRTVVWDMTLPFCCVKNIICAPSKVCFLCSLFNLSKYFKSNATW